PFTLDSPRPLLDVCGTGGDQAGLFNVSTTVLFVAAACGAGIVKHGNRGITSKSGGADALEALGIPIDLSAEAAAGFFRKNGFVFLFAPAYHPAFRTVAPVRKHLSEQGKRSVFNILGPLLNPARPDFQLAGVFHPRLLPIYTEVFRLLGRKTAWTVSGALPGGGWLDELSTLGKSPVRQLREGVVTDFEIDPLALGLRPATLAELQGGHAAKNAYMIEEILCGENRTACRDIVLLNAAGALNAAGLAADLPEGITRAAEALDSGAAWGVLEKARKS
ncbi:MAG TPA: anthranilate phosphoribosyltransferase, partial [Chthoniobacterales bacterium]